MGFIVDTIFAWQRTHPAPFLWLDHAARHSPDSAVVNAGGETIPVFQFKYDRPLPEGLAKFCFDGGIWIDYTGWPMYREQTLVATRRLSAGGFTTFLNAIGVNFSHTFDTTGEFRFPRSLKALGPLPAALIPNTLAPRSGNTILSSFGIRIGQGYYFYAYGDAEPIEVGNNGVQPEVYAAFIKSVVAPTAPTPSPAPTPTPDPESTPGGPSRILPVVLIGAGAFLTYNLIRRR